jgi:hypothetical protein
MQCHYLVSYVGKLWKDLIFVGQLMTVHSGFIVKNPNIFHHRYQLRNKRGC